MLQTFQIFQVYFWAIKKTKVLESISLPLYIRKAQNQNNSPEQAWPRRAHVLPGNSYVIFIFRGFTRRARTGQIKTPEPCKTEYVWEKSLSTRSWSGFLILSLEKNIVQDITQSQNALELKVLIHHNETVHPWFADSIKDSVQSIIQWTCVDTRETLRRKYICKYQTDIIRNWGSHTGERFFKASPTVRLKSS